MIGARIGSFINLIRRIYHKQKAISHVAYPVTRVLKTLSFCSYEPAGPYIFFNQVAAGDTTVGSGPID